MRSKAERRLFLNKLQQQVKMLTKKIILKTVSFLILVIFIIGFLANEHDRLRESGRKLICRFDQSAAGWICRFQPGMTGFSAFSFQVLQGPDLGSGQAVIELSPAGKPSAAVKKVSGYELHGSSVKLNFPASDATDWLLSIRIPGAGPSAEDDFHLKCCFYAGKVPSSYYWYGILIAGVFFLILGIADYRSILQNSGRTGKKANFDYGIHYFRATAIFFIMLLHYPFMSSSLRSLDTTLFSSASYFFIFISGYLFYYLTGSYEMTWTVSKQAPFFHGRTISGKFSVPAYYKKKLLNILLPYFLTASAIYIYIVLYSDTTQLIPAVPGTWADYFFRIRRGAVQQSHWYIFFISKVFLISPLLLFLPKKVFLPLTAASCILPFVFTRTESHFCYFLPMYLLGMAYARYRAEADRILIHPAVRILIPVLALGFLIYLYPGREEQDGLVFMTRVLSTVVLLYATKYLSRWRLPWLSYCADVSFSLFFIHDFIFAYLTGPFRNLYAPLYQVIPVMEFLVPVSLILASVMIVTALKTLFGSFSRRVIGS